MQGRMLSITYLIASWTIGLVLIYGGIKKFSISPLPPSHLYQTITENPQLLLNPEILKIKNFIFGLKQSNYFWQFLGIAELSAGILLISIYLSCLGAILALPLTLNIFTFHWFLEPQDTEDLVFTFFYLVLNLFLIGYHYKRLKKIIVYRFIFSPFKI